MNTTLTPLELRTPKQRDADLVLALQSALTHAKKNASYYSASLASIEVNQVDSLQALSALPVLRKADLLNIQTANPPLGGLLAVSVDQIRRIFQ